MFKLSRTLALALAVTLTGIGATVFFAKPKDQRVVVLKKESTLLLEGEIGPETVTKLQQEAIEMDSKLADKDVIYLVLNTPGGSITDGLLLINTLKALKHKVNTITILAASMGFHTVQSLGERLIIPGGQLMSHRASANGIGGEVFGNLESRIDALHNLVLEMDKVAAKRMGMSLSSYEKLIVNEYWTQGTEAVEQGAADEYIVARCDMSLMGTKHVFLTFMGMPLDVELSECPLISGPLNVKVGG